MYYLQNASAAGIQLDVRDLALGKTARACASKAVGAKNSLLLHATHTKNYRCGCKESGAIAWPELDQVEADYDKRIRSDWQELLLSIKTILAIELPKAAKSPEDLSSASAFTFSVEQRAMVMAALKDLSRRLEKLFGDKNADWERLARSEIRMAAETAKLDEWAQRGMEKVEFTPAPDACPICRALAGEYEIDKAPLRPVRDTHPRCRCANRPAA